jgi:hypothetical protein
MAISLAFGVIYATVISLLIVPAHYLILEDLKALLGRSRSRNERSGGAGARSGEGAIEGPASLPSTSA